MIAPCKPPLTRRANRRADRDPRPLVSAHAPEAVSRLLPIGSRINERGRLEVGGCDLLELAATYGTPAYVVAEDDLRARARAFLGGLRQLHPDSDVLYA